MAPQSSVTDSSGTSKATAKDYQFIVFSEDGTYKTSFDNTEDGSTGFVVGDLIKIEGSVLSGEDGTNDLIIEVLTVVNGKIDSIDVETSGTYNARTASAFKFEVIVKANDTNYDINYIISCAFHETDLCFPLEILVSGGDLWSCQSFSWNSRGRCPSARCSSD